MKTCRNCINYCNMHDKEVEKRDGMCNLSWDSVYKNETCGDFEINIYNDDGLSVMDYLIENEIKVDMILVDPPYQKTRGKWDVIIPLDVMWNKINKIIKDDGAICIFGNEPYSSMVRMSNQDMYRYDWKWVKNRATGFANCNYRPMSRYEDIMVFSKANASTGGKKNAMIYHPQGLKPINKVKKNTPKRHGLIQNDTNNVGKDNILMQETEYVQKYTNYPDNILEFDVESKYIHPTQKPVALLEYLIKTYTNENELVLDFAAGSFSTGEACINIGRRYLCVEKEKKYYDIGCKRLLSL